MGSKLKEKKFKSIPNKEKAIFLPHCLRNKDCKAIMGENGLMCVNCGKCGIGKFKKDAEEKGYKVFIVPGGSLVKKIIKKNDFKAVLGAACIPEIEQAFDFIKKTKLIAVAVPLLRDGCVNTDIDWKRVRELAGL